MSNIYGNSTWDRATQQLNESLDLLLAAGKLPLVPRPVRTLASARRHLGIDADAWIIQYAICPVCWKHHTPQELEELDSPDCSVAGCTGKLYTDSVNSKGKRRREPTKICPQVSMIESLRRMFMRPGFAKSLIDYRQFASGRNDNEDFIMEDMHDGEMIYKLSTGTIREVNSTGTIRDRPNDPRRPATKLTQHRYGLPMSMNLDWFGLLDGRPHSTGPIYVAINSLPRDQRYLQLNVICLAITPGPNEPNQQQLNHTLEPGLREMRQLHDGTYLYLLFPGFVHNLSCFQTGVKMEVHDEGEQDIYADFVCANCDTPAARKVNGTAGHAHDFHPCPYCDTNIVNVNKKEGYDYSWTDKDDYKMLKHAYRAKDVGPRRENAILRDHGVRWSIMNILAGWLPASNTVLDFMHNIFLGLIAHLFMEILFKAYMFSGAGGDNSAKQRFENVINAVRWPSHVTRLPKNLGENQSLKKADEWRRLLTITPIVLWASWKDQNDEIPDIEPPIPPNAKHNPEHSRNCRALYSAILLLCAGVRILASRKISMAQARIGQNFLVQYCRRLKSFGANLTINHHLSTHFAKFIKLFGPVYGWWLFAFERFNGVLERVHVNGHDGGRMELTLLRHWVQGHLIYEYVLSLPDEAHPLEREYIEKIIKSEGRSERGGMMTELAIYRSEATTDRIKLPRIVGKEINLRDYLGPGTGRLYGLVLAYCQQLYPDLNLIDDFSLEDGTILSARKVARALPYIRKDGIRYGSTANKRTKADSYTFISDGAGQRCAVEISALLGLKILDNSPHICAVIRRFKPAENLPPFPWDLYSSILGIHVSYAGDLGDYEVIPVSNIEAPLALIPVQSARLQRELWVSISFDHVIHSFL
ncbi:hypothetical protein B0H21DRAFT_701660 [Amylocystis lapponica]|nr:hypothetical protein B0H21DRAFT_701660 [Amylocystis lapponica]